MSSSESEYNYYVLSSLRSLKEQVARLKNYFENYIDDLSSSLERRLSAIEYELREIRNSEKGLQTRLESITSSLESLKSRVDRTEETMNRLLELVESTASAISASINAVQANLVRVDDKLDESLASLAMLQLVVSTVIERSPSHVVIGRLDRHLLLLREKHNTIRVFIISPRGGPQGPEEALIGKLKRLLEEYTGKEVVVEILTPISMHRV